MISEEDEAFNEIERQAKQRKESVKVAVHTLTEYQRGYETGFIDGMQKQAQSSVHKAVNAMSQRTEQDWGALAEKQLASIKRDMKATFEDAAIRATHKVMAEFETQPTQRTWVGLTDDEIDTWNIVGHESLREFVRAIEAKLKEKNND